MTAPEPEYEWGLQWPDGAVSTVTGGEAVAHKLLERFSQPGYSRKPVCVVRRPVAEWLPAPQTEAKQ